MPRRYHSHLFPSLALSLSDLELVHLVSADSTRLDPNLEKVASLKPYFLALNSAIPSRACAFRTATAEHSWLRLVGSSN